MIELSHKIPEDKYSQELLNELLKIPRTTEDIITEIKSLYDLVNCELTDNALKTLVKVEHYKLPEIQTENIDIIARINDAKFILGYKNKLSCIQIAVDSYFKVFESINDIAYFVRALELIKKIKASFENQLPEVEAKVLQILPQIESSYYQLKLIGAAMLLIQESTLKTLVGYFLKQLEQCFEKNEYRDAGNCIKALNKLGHFDNNECKMQTALCLERDADYQVSQKLPNTYYPNILSIYTDALKEIKGIVVDENLKTRLQQKIKNEQGIYVEMLRKAGISVQSEFNIADSVAKENVDDFISGFTFLLKFPFIESNLIKTVNDTEDKKYLWSKLCTTSEHITEKGTVSGISDVEQYILNFARDHFRNTIISVIREVKLIMDTDQSVSKDWVSGMVSESPFVLKGREYFFIEGIYSGFENNFINASHILVPQIENSLKAIIELNGRNTIQLAEDIQHDNTLGGILSINENGKMLDGICDRDLLLELNSFLVDGNSINFRNRICHGLISPFETEYYGIYLWWLTLKMVNQTSNYFKIFEKEE